MAMHTKVPKEQIAEFQKKYFGAFPCIPAWHATTIKKLQTTGSLTHLFGRRRYFFNRLDDQSTINAAIAYCPQGMTGDEINKGVLNLWRHGAFELLIQVHDSILFQIDQDRVNELVPIALQLLEAPLTLIGGRKFVVPVEAKTGWNWGDQSPTNPLGLTKWKGTEFRTPPRRLTARRVPLGSYL
jgi:DNA polymerase-1